MIKKAPTAQQLLSAADEHAEAFNAIHITAFWSRLGQLARTRPSDRRWLHSDPALLEPSRQRTLRLLPTFDPRNMANVAHGAAKAGLRTAPHDAFLWSKLASAALFTLGEFANSEIKDLAWAFATAGVQHARLFDALEGEAMPRLDGLDEGEVAMLAWSFAKIGHHAPDLHSALAAEAERRGFGGFKPLELASLAWALAQAEVGETCSSFFGRLAGHIAENASAFAAVPDALSTTAWAYGRSGRASPQTLEALAMAAGQADLGGMRARSLASLVTPYALCPEPLWPRSDALLEAAARQSLDAIGRTDAVSMTMLVRVFTNALEAQRLSPAASAHCRSFLERVAADFPHSRQFHHCTERELSLLAWAYGRSALPARPLLEAIAAVSGSRMGEFRGAGLVALAYGLSRAIDVGGLGADRARAEWPYAFALFEGGPLAEELLLRRSELSATERDSVDLSFERVACSSPFGDEGGSRSHDAYLGASLDGGDDGGRPYGRGRY